MVIIFKIYRRWINKRYITASRCPMYRWSIFAARSTRLTVWNASCRLWILDGRFVKNGFSLKRNADGSAIVHTEVPQARVIVTTTEDDTKSDKEDGHSANGISDTDNKGNSSTADISSSLNSISSNDNRSVGKVGTNGNLSDAVTGGISPQQNYSRQSVGNPSSMQEADAKQNEGKHNTYPQHLARGQTQQSNGSNANGYKPNDSHNGNQ